MTNIIAEEPINIQCPFCSKNIATVLVLRYESYKFTKYIYTCSECGQVLKITGDRRISGTHLSFIKNTGEFKRCIAN